MAVTSETTSVAYAGNGVTTDFAVPFLFFEDGDLDVFLAETDESGAVLKTLTTDYTVTGAGDPAGGTVTFVVAPPVGKVVLIQRWVDLVQETVFPLNGDLDSEALEQQLDRCVMMSQQLIRAFSGANFLDPTERLTTEYLTGDYTEWDADGLRLTNLDTPTDSTDAATKGYVDSIMAASGNVPTPDVPGDNNKVLTSVAGVVDWVAVNSLIPTPANPADDGKMLEASAGAYITRTAAQTRTTLGLGTAAILDVGTTASKVVQLTAAAKYPAVDGSLITNITQATTANHVLVYQDQKASGTAGGTFTQGAWQTRTINTEVADAGTLGSLAANQITLAAGTYLVYAQAPAYRVTQHRIRLYNDTAASVLIQGSNAFSSDSNLGHSHSSLFGIITMNGTDVISLRHWCNNTRSTDGFGLATTTGQVEVYASLIFVKLG